MENEINRLELKQFLKENGLRDINEDDVFDNYNITVFIDTEGEKGISISFAHSNDGWFKIDNPSFEKIKEIVLLFKESDYSESTFENVRKYYGKIFIKHLSKILLKNLK